MKVRRENCFNGAKVEAQFSFFFLLLLSFLLCNLEQVYIYGLSFSSLTFISLIIFCGN